MISSQSYSQNGSLATALPLSASNPQSIRTYFEKVRELYKSGNLFPVLLDDVWPLTYERKDMAVRVLKSDFLQLIDYQSLRKSPEKSKGRQVEVYSLSLPCMEFFIARKVRAVFDVYREVFHRVADMAEQAIAQRQETLVEIVNSLTDQMIGLSGKIDRMHKAREKYFKAKVIEQKQNNQQKLNAEKEQFRLKFLQFLDRYCKYASKIPSHIMDEVWDKLKRDYHIDVERFTVYQGEHKLDVAFRNGFSAQVYEVLAYQLTFSSRIQ